MGWEYEDRKAFGITVDAWDTPGLKDLLESYDAVLDYDAEMSLEGQGTLFVYVKSSYITLDEDSGSYTYSKPDVEGSIFDPPRHPIIHRVVKVNDYTLTDDELIALINVKEYCDISSDPVWIRHSYIS